MRGSKRVRVALRTLLAMLGTTACAVLASPPSEPVRVAVQGTPHDALFDLAFEGRRGIAVGAHGVIYHSADSGTSWERGPATDRPVALLGVAVQDGRCVAVGQLGTALSAPDCRQWTTAAPVTKARLNAVAMNRRGQAYAVGAFGTVLKSSDWGRSWQSLTVDWGRVGKLEAEPHLYGVHVGEDDTVTLIGEFELILRSVDAGAQWKTLHRGERSLFGLRLLDDGRGYAVGQSGVVLATGDGGATWRPLQSGTNAILTGVVASSDGRLVASGINTVVVSRDGGASWRPLASRLTASTWQQAAASATDMSGQPRFFTAGAGGTILQINK